MSVPAPDFSKAVTAPQRAFCEAEGISLSLLTALLTQGEIDSVVVGNRFRFIVLASWADYVRRKQFGLERDPAEREAAAARYRASVRPYSSAAAQRALAGKPRPGRPPGSGTKHRKSDSTEHAAAQTALPARRASPPKVAPKARSSKRQSIREENPTTV
jgi:hypothetical protein